jgi:PAS domain S-box-containing protein
MTAYCDETRTELLGLLEQVFENASIGMGIVRPDGSWFRVNQALCRLTGYEKEELLKHNIRDLTHPDDVDPSRSQFDKLIQGHIETYQLEKRYIRKDGRVVWTLLSVNRAVAPDGTSMAVGETQDITQSKASQESVRRSQALFRSIGENAGELILVAEFPSFLTEYASPTFQSLLGLSPSELVGRDSLELVPEEDRPLIEAAVRRLLGHGNSSDVSNVRFRDAHGQLHHVEAHGCAVRKATGEIERLVILGRIVDDRIAAQNELEARRQQLQLLLDSTAQGIYGVDRNGNCTFCNSACLRMLGCKDASEILGKNVHALFHHTRKEGRPCALEECCVYSSSQSGIPTRADDEVLWRTDNTSFPIELWAYPMRSEGKLVGSVVTFVDITSRKTAEDELRSKTAILEAQTNASLDGILIVDEANKVVFQNRRFRQMFEIPGSVAGETNDEVILAHVLTRVKNPEEFLERVHDLYSSQNKIARDEIELRNGTTLDRYSSPVIGKDGENYGRMWIFRDITERKRNEDAVRQLSVAVEQSPVALVITDHLGDITYVNSRFTETSGYTLDEVLGKNPRVLKSGSTSAAEYEHLWKTITSGGEWRGELRNRKKNGELYWESVAISPVKDDHGNITHFLAVKEDVTERKVMESQLRQVQKMEAIGQLAAGIAHEINTPIQFVGDNTRFVREAWNKLDPAISVLRSLVESDRPPEAPAKICAELVALLKHANADFLREEIPRALEHSLEGIARIARIVQAMKEFSHPGSDQKQLADINKAIITTITVARNEWKYVSEIETHLGSNMDPVPCHLGDFNQVILNLLINSVHAIAQVVGDGSGSKGKITITTSQDPRWTTIAVADTGSGIAPEIRSKVYDPFFTTKAVGKGTGQGLALAHNSIVKKHGGRLWFESEVGKGTTFYIQLPMAPEGTVE